MRGRPIADWLVALTSAVMLASCFFALHAAWRWPLVGDAGLIRYIVFLLQNGHAPYRQIIDVNWPGSYFIE